MSSREKWASIPPFANLERSKQHFIDNKWVDSVSGETFESINPSTGETLARVAYGDSADIDRAVTAAANALEGPWSRFKPAERERALLRLADLIEDNAAELGLLNVAEMGVPVNAAAGRGTGPDPSLLRRVGHEVARQVGRDLRTRFVPDLHA